ncbi:MAG: hypothetical protein EFKGCFLK_00567 [Rhodocyclaceae bacterium]|nr:hypothetical protein [Rhodocyclaceae bacterium]
MANGTSRREVLAGNKELAAKLGELERKLKGHDQAIAGILDAIRCRLGCST